MSTRLRRHTQLRFPLGPHWLSEAWHWITLELRPSANRLFSFRLSLGSPNQLHTARLLLRPVMAQAEWPLWVGKTIAGDLFIYKITLDLHDRYEHLYGLTEPAACRRTGPSATTLATWVGPSYAIVLAVMAVSWSDHVTLRNRFLHDRCQKKKTKHQTRPICSVHDSAVLQYYVETIFLFLSETWMAVLKPPIKVSHQYLLGDAFKDRGPPKKFGGSGNNESNVMRINICVDQRAKI